MLTLTKHSNAHTLRLTTKTKKMKDFLINMAGIMAIIVFFLFLLTGVLVGFVNNPEEDLNEPSE